MSSLDLNWSPGSHTSDGVVRSDAVGGTQWHGVWHGVVVCGVVWYLYGREAYIHYTTAYHCTPTPHVRTASHQ